MKPVECPYEAEVLSAVLQSRWSGRDSSSLREHGRRLRDLLRGCGGRLRL